MTSRPLADRLRTMKTKSVKKWVENINEMSLGERHAFRDQTTELYSKHCSDLEIEFKLDFEHNAVYAVVLNGPTDNRHDTTHSVEAEFNSVYRERFEA